MCKSIVIISGPTACGKTSISIELAKKINGEIISADSMQVYKKMNIGTAKVSIDEMQGIKHYMIDEIEPNEDFSVALFKERAKQYINEIYTKGKVPIIVGGTGFYINSIIFDNQFQQNDENISYKNELQNLANQKGNNYLYNILKEIDYDSSKKIHPNNLKKVIRAIEFFKQTGIRISEHNELEKQRRPLYNYQLFILNMDREKLYNKINHRVDDMIKNGLVDEVNNLIQCGYSKTLISMQGIGYKEIISYIQGECNLSDAIDTIKRNTRRFAKRQLTWFRNQCDGFWIDLDTISHINTIISIMEDKLKLKNII